MAVRYDLWLLAISAAFFTAERIWPWRKDQPLRRPGLVRDAGFVALNGFGFGLLTGSANAWIARELVVRLYRLGFDWESSPVPGWPFAAQALAVFLLSDVMQWSIHNLLHRVPWLWQFHKVHHSVHTMDWLGYWRFHWMEAVVYRSLQWLPLAWLGASPDAVFVAALVNVAWGNFNHANLDVGLGPLGYVFNSPRMHLWHHDVSTEGGVSKNFGITLSVWDFLFRTSYWPRDRSPAVLGYPGDVEMPKGFLGQVTWPAARLRRSRGGATTGAPPAT